MPQKVFAHKKHEMGYPFDPGTILNAYIEAQIEAETLELEGWLTECIQLADFDRIDDIFIAILPDGSRVVQSWWNRPYGMWVE